MLNWIPVQSSVIAAVAYQGHALYVRFHSNRIYEYLNVPTEVYIQLLRAPSKGRYFNMKIKLHYECRFIR